jgi:hypothetical protein
MQLVINTFGASLRKEGERFLVKAGDKQFAVSAHKVQSILITTGAMLSTDAIQLASDNNIDRVHLSDVPGGLRQGADRRLGLRPETGGGRGADEGDLMAVEQDVREQWKEGRRSCDGL